MSDSLHPTPYADVNVALRDLLSSERTILGDEFHGMYLSGSLALGDFASYRSDIDFVVVTGTDVSSDLLSALQAMHARFNAGDSPWATEVEAAYIPLGALRRHDPAHARHPHIQRGARETLYMDQLDSGWVLQRYILREHGVVVAGPALRPLIDPVHPDEMRRAVVEIMGGWWGTMHHDPAPLRRTGYEAYAVLTMCRILYTFTCGTVVSKPVAARWALETLGGRWDALIERALAWRKDQPDTLGGDVGETLGLIQYTLERCQGSHATSSSRQTGL